MLTLKVGTAIVSKKGERGHATGGGYACGLEGCRGWRIGTRWNDGRITFPCSKSMIEKPNGEWHLI